MKREGADVEGTPAAKRQATAGDMSRRVCIGGNWKCNGTVAKVQELVAMLNGVGDIPPNVDVVVAPPALHVGTVMSSVRKDINVAIQNAWKEPKVSRTFFATLSSQPPSQKTHAHTQLHYTKVLLVVGMGKIVRALVLLTRVFFLPLSLLLLLRPRG